jgi:hypothetical protein
MTLLEELRTERDYWLVPAMDGNRFDATWSAAGIDRIIRVAKGANDPELEFVIAYNGSLMAEALGDKALADRLAETAERMVGPCRGSICPSSRSHGPDLCCRG